MHHACLRVTKPVPHDFEHAVHADQVLGTQSTAQACALHDLEFVFDGQTLPPKRGCVRERVRN